jgi:DNA-binding MarR family transcriptional regulator
MPTALVRAERSHLSGETLQFMQKLWDLAHALDVRSKRMAKLNGVTGPQRLVIRVLGQRPGMTASEISRTLGMHPSTLTGILARLKRKGAIERKVDALDRRRVRLRLTPRGAAIDRDRKGTVEAAVRRALGRANDTSINVVTLMLEALTQELGRGE